MGWDVQINPHAEALHISPALAQLLEEHVHEFQMLYGWLEPEGEAVQALRSFTPDGEEEVRAVREIIQLLESGEKVEVLLGH